MARSSQSDASKGRRWWLRWTGLPPGWSHSDPPLELASWSRYWSRPKVVQAPDGRTYEVRLMAAWMDTYFDPRVQLLLVPSLLHLIWVVIGRGWRVEVTEAGQGPGLRKWGVPEPYIDVIGVTRRRRVAQILAMETADLILQRGWVKGVTHT